MADSTHLKVSVVICTRSRAADLSATLASIALAHVPADLAVEVIVVDNGSQDETRDVVAQATQERMPVRRVYVENPGMCKALNCVLQTYNGDIVLKTDDDVRVPSDWIDRMCRPIADGRADACAGGFLHPASHVRDWMKRSNAHGWLTDDFMHSGAGFTMLGLNMAFARHVLAKVPRFDDELGPGALGFSDDTLFSLQLQEAGFRTTFVDVRVEHHFPLARLTRLSLLRRAEAVGRSEAYVEHHWLHSEPRNRLARIAILRAMLAARRLAQGRQAAGAEGLSQWEFDWVRRIATHRQARVEARRKPNYTLRGLSKVPTS